MNRIGRILAALLAAAAVGSTGCTTGAYCFRDCEEDAGGSDAGARDASNDWVLIDADQECLLSNCGIDDAAVERCVLTNGGIEVCDGLDNDCNGGVDDVDKSKPENCGGCGASGPLADCGRVVSNVAGVTCQSDACGYTTCLADYHDFDKDPKNGCEAFCSPALVGGVVVTDESDPALRCNRKDDDCDNQVDEDVDVCSDVLNCGKCGTMCVVSEGTPACEHAVGGGACDLLNTQCKIGACNPGHVDLDHKYANGCEYTCTPTAGGVEVCDDVDNDCDGLIDQFDPSLTDARVGIACNGSTLGVCGLPAHAGTATCHNGVITCDGPNVLMPGVAVEACNGLDDDCNGAIDDNASGVGSSCGSNTGNCSAGSNQCVAGALSCIGFFGPTPEVCNGQDDDCDGVIDNQIAGDGSACGLAVGACKAGTRRCVSGAVVCTGAITPQAETCNGVDDDCNGTVDDSAQGVGLPCGSSVGACRAGTRACQGGSLTCVGAVGGTAEICNGVDDDCNGIIDDSPAGQGVACGSAVGACHQGSNQCINGAFACIGAAGPQTETCNGFDDDCNGVVDDNPTGQNTACGSAVGACRKGQQKCQSGVFACVGAIGAVDETCNGVDDDCNGTVDDNPTGQNAPCGTAVGACRKGQQKCQSGAFACVGSTSAVAETCNGIDDDCNGTVDDGAAGQGASCGSAVGACAAGQIKCQNASLVCVGAVGGTAETCNGIDDDCNGTVDDNPSGENQPCGSSIGACTAGVKKCQGGSLVCVGAVGGTTETCNGQDDDCDGVIDNHLTDVGGACNVPPAAPSGGTSPCRAGTFDCVAGAKTCVGSVVAQQATDKCSEDSNCDGLLSGQPDLATDVHNCGSCGHDCSTLGGHGIWGCSAGQCARTGCVVGFYNCDGNAGDCERACTFVSAIEQCNAADDNCDCNVDELKDVTHPNGIVVPSSTQVCGVGLAAANPGACTTGTTVSCQAGAWTCAFPAGYCTGANCGQTAELCDGLDNNCDGNVDESFKRPVIATKVLGDACASDDASPGSQGACRTTGTYVCAASKASTACSAAAASCASLPGGCTEVCDGVDNDCDGSIDEPKQSPGSAATYVSPAVVQLGPALWMYAYEASRPSATTSTAGTGNGYWSAAPAGATLDKTPSCSTQGKIPWFNVTPTEVSQVCSAMGGRICKTTEWRKSCTVDNTGGTPTPTTNSACTWGYGPRGATCTTSSFGTTGTCNLGAYDFVPDVAGTPSTLGVQHGLLPTGWGGAAPPAVATHCFADWANLNANGTTKGSAFDLTGNLREITCNSATCDANASYPLMGGAFNTADEQGAACGFTFYSVNATFQLFDAGFRCCFDSNPQ